MLENGKELDRSPDLFWTINSLVLAHHCHLSSGDGNVCLIFHQKMKLHFFCMKSHHSLLLKLLSVLFLKLTTKALSQLQQMIFSL